MPVPSGGSRTGRDERFFRFCVLSLATVGFLSYAPYRLVPFTKWKGGGLLGSLAGWVLFWLLPEKGPLLWLSMAGVLSLSVFVSHQAERLLGQHDDPRIIIDEVIGVWLACAALPRALGPLAAGLVLFRFFDALKGPWGRWAARAPGGWGVVADDVLAGVLANLVVRLLLCLAPGFLR